MKVRYHGTKLVRTRATLWRGFRAIGAIAMAVAAALLLGILLWNMVRAW